MMVGETLTDALTDAAAPTGTLALVNGFDAGIALVRHPAIAAVAFTGSLAGGRALFDIACSRPDPIPFYGELGSVNPVVVTTAAARSRGRQIGAEWVGSMTLGGGQFCTKPGLLLVPSGSSDEITSAIAATVAAAPAAVLLNESIRSRFRSGVARLDHSTSLVARSEADASEGFHAQPVAVRTTVADALKSPEVLDEVFGPVGVILEYDSLDEVVALLGRLGGSLTMTIHGEDADPEAPALVDVASTVAGRVIWNGYPTGVAVSASMQHGGPWPASTSPRDTSVGSASIARFVRAVTYQAVPESLLPAELR